MRQPIGQVAGNERWTYERVILVAVSEEDLIRGGLLHYTNKNGLWVDARNPQRNEQPNYLLAA